MLIALTAATTVSLLSVVLARSPSAAADTAPVAGTTATVSADPLPTVQINGVVWAQVTVGNTVYAAGEFTSARPAGSAAGQNETPRANLLAYDVRTGVLNTSFDHKLNAAAKTIVASPDGSRIYVGGIFTTVDGLTRSRVAAFDTATGALVTSFAPSFDNPVAALTATATTVYAGGNFTVVNGIPRQALASVSATDGALSSWAPTAATANGKGGGVDALIMTPDRSRVIVGGRFTTINGQPTLASASLDAATGAQQPWAANQSIRNGGDAQGGILTLATDGRYIYGGGWAFTSNPNNFEGTFAADPMTGAIIWANDCHGDTYSVFPIGSALYTAGHAHDCSAAGNFPDTVLPGSSSVSKWQSQAYSTSASSRYNRGPDTYGWNWSAQRTSDLLHWFPRFTIGTYTGQSQAAWTASGNSDFVALGGEFLTVQGVAQQGLVRFAVRAGAPNKTGPITPATPTTSRSGFSTVRVTVQTVWDADNRSLTYSLIRDGNTANPVATQTVDSTFWNRPNITLADTSAQSGTTYRYSIVARDPLGNSRTSPTVST